MKDDEALREEMRKLAKESIKSLAREDAQKYYDKEFERILDARLDEIKRSYNNLDKRIQDALAALINRDLANMSKQPDGNYKYDLAVKVEEYLAKVLPEAINKHVNASVIKKELIKVLSKLD
jgi:hypothetical protein